MNDRSNATGYRHNSGLDTRDDGAANGGPAQGDIDTVEHVRAITKAAGSSFYWAMRILPESRRDAMFAVYAFCRDVDDITDGNASPERKITRLEAWRAQIDLIYDGTPESILARALVDPVCRYGLARKDFHAVIDGMEMDVRGSVLAPPMEELQRYCDRVAGAVGLLSVRIFGAEGDRARDFALTLGTALQLTNILRDLKEDAAMDRLYLPRELLDAAGITGCVPETVLGHPGLPRVCDALADLAKEKYERARALLATGDRKPLKPAIVMMMHYWRILGRLRRRGWENLDESVGLPIWEKLWVAFRYGIL